MNIFIEKASYIVTPSERELVVYRNRDILIEDKFIVCIDTECLKPRDAYVIKGYNKVICPGFINTNIYVVNYFIQKFLVNSFSQHLFNNIARVEKEVVSEDVTKYIYRIICLKLLSSGFIGLIPTTSYPHILLRECREYGQYIGLGPVKGFKETISVVDFKSICSEYDKCIPVYTVFNPLDMVHEDVVDELQRAFSIGFRKKIEISRSRSEVYLFKKNTDKWPVEYLFSKNLIDKYTLLTHLNWITSMELDYLKTTSVFTSLSPSTTLFIGERGFPPIHEIMSRDIPVTIGFSGLFNTDLSLFNELRMLYSMYRFLYGDNRADPVKILYHIIYYPYLFLGIENRLLSVNSIANIVVLKTNLVYLPSSILSMFFNNFQVEYVVINGCIYLSPFNSFYYRKLINEYFKSIVENISF